MAQSTPTFRTETLVLREDAHPSRHLGEFLNSLSEGEERNLWAFLTGPEFALFAACRQIELDELADDDWGAAS
ncbi:hypothetical protein AB0C10_26950 [Microbispora amethystogenes]|uniref:hypothetical protein n=1 Tax=Microbispora amethystogenes TaxID=1427754 RepID=UPI00340B41EA